MRDMVAACAAGKVAGKIVVDLEKEEDNLGQADVPIAIMPRTGEILLLQMDGHLTATEFEQVLDMATEACKRIGAIQREALLNRYSTKPDAVKEGVATLDSTASPDGGDGNGK